jgi:hypothetical protein
MTAQAQGVSSSTLWKLQRVLSLCGTVENRQSTAIGMFLDEVLLDIFDFYQNYHDDNLSSYTKRYAARKWYLPLVHVCRRWRQVIFDSPHRLHLDILCTYRTPVKKSLGIWPSFPIVINYAGIPWTDIMQRYDIIAALEHPDRVRYLALDLPDWFVGMLDTVIQRPFPVLTHLIIHSPEGDEDPPLLPAEFLGGSAPRLQEISLSFISFPELPILLSSARDLVTLNLRDIPPTGYISPEAIVACLAILPRLKTCEIRFRSTTTSPASDQIHPHPRTRTVLPALTRFQLDGAGVYLEDFAARIDCPLLNSLYIVYFGCLVDLRITQLANFFERIVGPKISPFKRANVCLDTPGLEITFHTYLPENYPEWHWHLARTAISGRGVDWQISRLAQMLNQFSAMLTTVVYLELEVWTSCLFWNVGSLEWSHFLHQFSTVRALSVSESFAGCITDALKSITGEMAAEAFASLDLIYLEGEPTLSLEKFVGVRKLSGRPVTVANTVAEFDQRLEGYLGK